MRKNSKTENEAVEAPFKFHPDLHGAAQHLLRLHEGLKAFSSPRRDAGQNKWIIWYLRYIEATVADLIKKYESLSRAHVLLLGDANDNRPVRHAGEVGVDFVSVTIKLTLGRLQAIRSSIDVYRPIEMGVYLSNFADQEILDSWTKALVELKKLPLVEFEELDTELLAEWRRYWKLGGKGAPKSVRVELPSPRTYARPCPHCGESNTVVTKTEGNVRRCKCRNPACLKRFKQVG
jgi:hypothetical protein